MEHEATIRDVGVSMAEGGAGAPVVLLEARSEIVPIFVDGGQAQSIERARQGMPLERPMTHDLFVDVIDDLDGTLEQVRIDDLADETFYAKLDLVVEQDGESEKVVRDARPSDGLALAARVDCPVLVADDVIDEAGQPPGALGVAEGDQGFGGPMGGGPARGPGPGAGGEEPDFTQGDRRESPDLDDAVDIDIEDAEDDDGEDDPDD